jgi:hypothetical protein
MLAMTAGLLRRPTAPIGRRSPARSGGRPAHSLPRRLLGRCAGRFRVAASTATKARFLTAILIAFNARLTDLSTSVAASRAAWAAALASLTADTRIPSTALAASRRRHPSALLRPRDVSNGFPRRARSHWLHLARSDNLLHRVPCLLRCSLGVARAAALAAGCGRGARSIALTPGLPAFVVLAAFLVPMFLPPLFHDDRRLFPHPILAPFGSPDLTRVNHTRGKAGERDSGRLVAKSGRTRRRRPTQRK